MRPSCWPATAFAVVDDGRAACGSAARRHAQVVIADVLADPAFAPHRETVAASDFRAVQSTFRAVQSTFRAVQSTFRAVQSTH
jgi:hypothetical protein